MGCQNLLQLQQQLFFKNPYFPLAFFAGAQKRGIEWNSQPSGIKLITNLKVGALGWLLGTQKAPSARVSCVKGCCRWLTQRRTLPLIHCVLLPHAHISKEMPYVFVGGKKLGAVQFFFLKIILNIHHIFLTLRATSLNVYYRCGQDVNVIWFVWNIYACIICKLNSVMNGRS